LDPLTGLSADGVRGVDPLTPFDLAALTAFDLAALTALIH